MIKEYKIEANVELSLCFGMRELPVTTFRIKKRINTKLLIDRTAPLYIGEKRIRDVTNQGGQQVGTS